MREEESWGSEEWSQTDSFKGRIYMEVREPDVVFPKTLHPEASAGKSLENKPSPHRAVREGI